MRKSTVSAANNSVRSAFINLLKKKSYQDIFVKDIIEASFINKSTFYKYYNGKQDLLIQIEQDLLEGLTPLLDSALTVPHPFDENPYLVEYFSYIRRNFDLYYLLTTKVTDEFVAMQTKFIYDHLLKQASSRQKILGHDPSINQDLFAVMTSSMYSGLFQWWVQHHMPYSDEVMGKLLCTWWKRLCAQL